MQAPNPSANTAKVIKAKPSKASGSIKRDINLLPANENSQKIARTGTVVLAVFVGAALLSYFVIFMPLMQLQDLQASANNASNQVAQYQKYDAEFTKLIAQRNLINDMLKNLDTSEKGYLQPADMFSKLSQACPDDMVLLAVEQSETGLIIGGQAGSDDEIAQFIVNLKSLSVFQQIELVSVVQDTKDNTNLKRVFQLKALLPPAATATPATTAAPESTAKGGN
jgi:type IV pilus assembly protein PilN